MLIHKGFRYRIYPTDAQQARMAAWSDALRFLWNLALEQRLMGMHRTDKVYPSVFDQFEELKDLRADLPWLSDVPIVVCRQVIIELDKAWQRCFKRISSAPRWKRKGRDFLNFCDPNPKIWRLSGSMLRFPKLGNVRSVIHRPLEGKSKSCTITRDGDQWFASIMCEIEIAQPATPAGPPIGIDRGVTNLLADSEGRLVPNPKHLKASQRRLARAQRQAAHKRKGSNNRRKANIRVARIHRKVRRQRDHVLHVESLRYAKSHSVIVIESLKILNMSRSASGTVENPGTNIAQKTGLNRSIMSAGWGRFGGMLGYKTVWYGSTKQEVYPAYSSMECALCHCIDARNRDGEKFHCVGCGNVDHADNNAAKVIVSRRTDGKAVCGGSGTGRPVKQKLRVVRRGIRHAH
jgi:putative transposase